MFSGQHTTETTVVTEKKSLFKNSYIPLVCQGLWKRKKNVCRHFVIYLVWHNLNALPLRPLLQTASNGIIPQTVFFCLRPKKIHSLGNQKNNNNKEERDMVNKVLCFAKLYTEVLPTAYPRLNKKQTKQTLIQDTKLKKNISALATHGLACLA